jgi:geranylgeranyl diphosphate synthase type I
MLKCLNDNMDARDYLKEYKNKVDPFLKEYFNNKKKESKKLDPLAEQAVSMIAKFTMASGKRIRPAIMYYAFLADKKEGEVSSEMKKAIVEASMSVELTHTFLLIHDDIIDRDSKRHGTKTIHEEYKGLAERFFPKADECHFGNSMAMIVGDIAASMANEILFESSFKANNILRSLTQLQKIVYRTIPGEMLDIVMEARGETTEEEILRMHEGKTANYTFEGPMHLGAALAGNLSEKFLDKSSQYSRAVGKAFQIRDDILGVFGDEKKLGKPVGSDVIEGKQTLLYIKAKEKASKEQKNQLLNLLGKKDLNEKELKVFQDIVRDTGSLSYSEDLADKLSQEAIASLKEADIKNQRTYDFLKKIAEYIARREN